MLFRSMCEERLGENFTRNVDAPREYFLRKNPLLRRYRSVLELAAGHGIPCGEIVIESDNCGDAPGGSAIGQLTRIPPVAAQPSAPAVVIERSGAASHTAPNLGPSIQGNSPFLQPWDPVYEPTTYPLLFPENALGYNGPARNTARSTNTLQ